MKTLYLSSGGGGAIPAEQTVGAVLGIAAWLVLLEAADDRGCSR